MLCVRACVQVCVFVVVFLGGGGRGQFSFHLGKRHMHVTTTLKYFTSVIIIICNSLL